MTEEIRRPTLQAIEFAVSAAFNMSPGAIKMRTQKRVISRPRQIAFYLARKYTDKSFPQIGRYFGYKDHTTVLYGSRAVANLIEKKPTVAANVDRVVHELKLRGYTV